MKIKQWLNKNTKSLNGTTIVITGSSGGIGKEISLILASLNAKLIFANRDEEKTNNLKLLILKKYPNVEIEFIKLDLESLTSINSFIDNLKNRNIDILIHNAGIYNVKRKTLSTGFDNIFQVNFLAPYYISKELLPYLNKSHNPLIIGVSSIAHNYSKIDESNIEFLNKSPSKSYGNSKRLLTFSLYELLKDNDVKLSIAHPGITLTNMTNHYPKSINWLVKIGIKLIFPSPKKAALNIVYSIFNPCEYKYWIGPRFFNIWGYPKKKKLHTCDNKESSKIFEIAQDGYYKLKELS
jgi:short-subunit dehydrogenase